MDLHVNEKTAGELTWNHRGLDSPDPKNKLRHNENGKYTNNQLVSIRREWPDLNLIALVRGK